jgi:putative hydrolase of the HAD superfamily
MNESPQVIFLDAVGTLFGVRGSVGEVYAELARSFGVEVDAKPLNRAFYESFKAAPPPIFPDIAPAELPVKEFEWWRDIAIATFSSMGVLDRFADFDEFFDRLYAHFATADPWFVYPDVYPALDRWREMGIALGIVSNFDSRLYTVLNALDIGEFFTSVTISTEVGAAKPERQIFTTALDKHGCPAGAAWHIGDSYSADYEGANASGIKGIWLKR